MVERVSDPGDRAALLARAHLSDLCLAGGQRAADSLGGGVQVNPAKFDHLYLI
jgi:hypothetical protein